MVRVRQILTLAGFTALETFRQPVILLLSVGCVFATAVAPLMLVYQFGEEGRLARDSGLAFHLLAGLFVAGTAAASALSRELQNGTASAVLSKPVGRGSFFVAKYLGVATVVLAFSCCATISTLLSERVSERFVETTETVGYFTDGRAGLLLLAAPLLGLLAAGVLNYRKQLPFESTAYAGLLAGLVAAFVACSFFDRLGHVVSFDPGVDWRILPASLLVTLALLLLASLALALSSFLSLVPTLAGCAVILLAGLLSDHVLGRAASEGGWASVLYAVIPNWQYFWVSDALADHGRIAPEYVNHVGRYAFFYIVAVLSGGALAFRKAEVL